MENTKLIGIHNGIQYLVRESDGVDFYYSTGSKKTAMSIQGIARMVEGNVETIANKATQLGILKESQLLTMKGIQATRFVTENDIAGLLKAIIDSRMKKATRQRAEEIREKYIQAGFRLQVLLEVAPEVVAKEAINKIKDPEKAKDVSKHADQHSTYLKSFHKLGDELKANDCRYGVIHGFNNKLVGIEKGKRAIMSPDDKDSLIMIQIAERKRLAKRDFNNGIHAENAAKKTGRDTANFIKNI